MMTAPPDKPGVAIACGGTGGHLFPGLAVAEQLARRGCAATLLISPKEVDRQATQTLSGIRVAVLPAVGLTRGRVWPFARGFWASYQRARQFFASTPPQAVLAMGGFTSAPPVLAARRLGICAFLHESNAIPGRANRWLSRVVDGAFLGFPSAAARLYTRRVEVTGTPVRSQFRAVDRLAACAALGLDPARPVVLVTGGSQGARAVNDLVTQALPRLAEQFPLWQWIHLTGAGEDKRVNAFYHRLGLRAVVQPFCGRMEQVLAAAAAVVSRAGASSLAELAALRVPALLVPYPAAADNHQLYNARAFVETGASRLLEQHEASPDLLSQSLSRLVLDRATREEMQIALARWDAPQAADRIADRILEALKSRTGARASAPTQPRPGTGSAGSPMAVLSPQAWKSAGAWRIPS